MSTALAEYPTALERGWFPQYTSAATLELNAGTIGLLTHSSRHFDPLETTKYGVDSVVARMKRRGMPVLYLHDNANSKNPPWNYLYADGRPTAFVPSDIGEFDTDFSEIQHVVSLGGFYWCCQQRTLTDVVKRWRRDAASDHNFRVTQVVDGIFDVTEGVRHSDPYYDAVRDYFFDEIRAKHQTAAMSLGKILQLINDTDAEIDFVKRQLDTTQLPHDVDIVLDYFGRDVIYRKADRSTRSNIQLASSSAPASSKDAGSPKPAPEPDQTGVTNAALRSAPRLTIAYRTSENFLVRGGDTQWLARDKQRNGL